MRTQCSHCGTVFRIVTEDLDVADGLVRCGKCTKVFDARATLTPEAPEAEGAAETPLAASAATEAESYLFNEEELRLFAADAPPAETAVEREPRTRGWGVLAAVLLAVLLLQASYFERHRLGAHPMLRPLVERACSWIGCAVALPHEPDSIRLIDRDVRNHPRRARALLVNLTMVNESSLPQAFPQLGIELTAINERTVARRRLHPRDYLSPEVDILAGMAPHMPLRVSLEFAAPRQAALGFRIELL